MAWDEAELRLGVLREFAAATEWSIDDAESYENKMLALRRVTDAKRQQEKRKSRLVIGLCARCDTPRDPDSKRHCTFHREQNRTLAAFRRRGMRERLKETREGVTMHFTITSRAPEQFEGVPPKLIEVDGYVTTGVYENGQLGEFFVRVGKGAAQFGPSIDRWAEACSIAIQYGAPVEVILGKSVGTRDDIQGAVTGVADIKDAEGNAVSFKRCTSPHDLIARWLLMKYRKKS